MNSIKTEPADDISDTEGKRSSESWFEVPIETEELHPYENTTLDFSTIKSEVNPKWRNKEEEDSQTVLPQIKRELADDTAAECSHSKPNLTTAPQNDFQESKTGNRRKRPRNPEQWEKNKKKLNRNSGKSYQTVEGNIIRSRCIQPPCGQNCRLKCSQRMTESARVKIFEEFWKMGDLTRQRDFINKCLSLVKPKYTMHKEDSKRSFNNAYSFRVDGELIRICKKYFQSTLDVGNCFISTAIKKMSTEGTVEEEKRGKHGKRGRALDESIKNGIRNHITSYPKLQTWDCCERDTKVYLKAELNLCLMYRQYRESCVINKLEIAKQSMYEHIFRTEYNISFTQPVKERCSVCFACKTSSQTENISLETKLKTHRLSKNPNGKEKGRNISSVEEKSKSFANGFNEKPNLQTPHEDDSFLFEKTKT